MSESKSNERNIILFDGVCNLCTGFVHLILRFDKKELYTFASLQSESGQQLLQEFSHPLDDNNTFYTFEAVDVWIDPPQRFIR